MFARLLFESFRRQRRRKAFALLAIALGMALSTAMISVATDIGDKVTRELRALNTNLVLTPMEAGLDVTIGANTFKPAGEEKAFIPESDLPRLKGIFWGNNIVGFAPFLFAQQIFFRPAGPVTARLIGTYFDQPYGKANEKTGVRSVNSFWHVEGEWPADAGFNGSFGALAGVSLAHKTGLRPGDTLEVGDGKAKLRITGILTTGGVEDDAIVAPLHMVQQVLGKPGAVDRVAVSARTKPEDAFARRDPNSMSPEMHDRWYCSPYANSIAFQIHEALPAVQVEQVRQVEQNQGKVLSRISGLMLLLTIAALLATALAVSAVMAGTVIERRQEVGLMKSLGAGNGLVATLFLTEAGLLAIIGGGAGFAGGVFLARYIGQSVFNSPIVVAPVVLAVVIFAALMVAFAGSTGAVRKAMRFDPAVVLRGDA
ncbi:MAG TPA: ABC transporter permease [Candidatus Saccharimonadales bacterium]|jgi:putative ABC transport system permease protein|nr:ABC transporter permease [Candidatus Saccharimonadales bacterium]